MPNNELDAQLEGLFDDVIHESEVEQFGADVSLEKTILDLLENKDAGRSTPLKPSMVDAPLFSQPPSETPSAGQAADDLPEQAAPAQKFAPLIKGLMVAGGAFLALFLIRLIWQWPPMTPLLTYALYFGFGLVILIAVALQWQDNVSLKKALQQKSAQLTARPTPSSLSERVKQLMEINAQLQQRAFQLQAATRVSRRIATADLDQVMQEAVDAITEHFDFYHTGLFLVDKAASGVGARWAVLQAGSGKVGQEMLAQDHKIKVGSASLVGWCAAHKRVQALPDPDGRFSWQDMDPNPLLPDTRSELALPLTLPDQSIGVLDIHSSDRQIFSEEIINLLQMIADQVVAAIGHARTLSGERAEAAREAEIEQAVPSREEEASDLSALSAERSLTRYERTHQDAESMTPAVQEKIRQAVQQAVEKRVAFVQASTDEPSSEAAVLVSPIQLRGQAIGVLGLSETDKRRWTREEIALVETIVDQMALAIENARLLRDTQLRAERERLSADISAKVRASTDVDNILRTAIRELGRTLHASEGHISLSVEAGEVENGTKAELDNEESEGETEAQRVDETLARAHASLER